jgi:hypothetical protein
VIADFHGLKLWIGLERMTLSIDRYSLSLQAGEPKETTGSSQLSIIHFLLGADAE